MPYFRHSPAAGRCHHTPTDLSLPTHLLLSPRHPHPYRRPSPALIKPPRTCLCDDPTEPFLPTHLPHPPRHPHPHRRPSRCLLKPPRSRQNHDPTTSAPSSVSRLASHLLYPHPGDRSASILFCPYGDSRLAAAATARRVPPPTVQGAGLTRHEALTESHVTMAGCGGALGIALRATNSSRGVFIKH
ncbi:hypothetical protein PGTUg99_010338 [Puccinia graminis f. sp. tritici]|uniref:Uncharacterized protein n=1 Tax=Puccinia graminis f. sp. tritici TaxID=56615 RepID=A0A5B0MFP8_PUCGR|nr:hypothetical protein PGTUg99_010338 [Puccinia graminis f. sp. tritici]